MKYKIIFNASRDNHTARDSFSNYLSAVRDGLDLVDDCLSIYPEYDSEFIEFEIKILELSKDKHYRFINKLQSALYEFKDLFECEQITLQID